MKKMVSVFLALCFVMMQSMSVFAAELEDATGMPPAIQVEISDCEEDVIDEVTDMEDAEDSEDLDGSDIIDDDESSDLTEEELPSENAPEYTEQIIRELFKHLTEEEQMMFDKIYKDLQASGSAEINFPEDSEVLDLMITAILRLTGEESVASLIVEDGSAIRIELFSSDKEFEDKYPEEDASSILNNGNENANTAEDIDINIETDAEEEEESVDFISEGVMIDNYHINQCITYRRVAEVSCSPDIWCIG